MHTVKLRQWIEGSYVRISYPNFEKLELITDFLSEIGGLIELAKDGLIKDNCFHFQTIYADLENNEVVLYDIDDEDDPPFKFIMPYKKFINLLDRWWEVYKCLPDFIEISMDDQDNIEIKAVE